MKLFYLALLLFSKSVLAQVEVTPENFAFAETQNQFQNLLRKIKLKFQMGTGYFAHSDNTTNPRDDTIPRPNFDTLYSAALIDFSTPVKVTIGDSGRYQSVLVITDNHYMPTFFINTNPGTRTLTRGDVGADHAMLVARTLTQEGNEEDKQEAFRVQRTLALKQDSLGKYNPQTEFDQDDLEALKKHYINELASRTISSAEMFGPDDGSITQENHNIGAATGWGGNPPQRAVYVNYLAQHTGPWKLTLKNVPVRAFWSVTVYDYLGFVETKAVEKKESYHLNSQWAKEKEDGVYELNFVDSKGLVDVKGLSNLLASYPGWNFVLRLYEPKQKIIDGTWVEPELKRVDCKKSEPKKDCVQKGCEYIKKDPDTNEPKCQKYESNAKKLCKTFLGDETCNVNTGVCVWNTNKERCDVFKCKKQNTEEDCVSPCKWNSKKEKCK